MTKIIDGKALAKGIRDGLAGEVLRLKEKRKITPRLCVLLAGEDPASQLYVRNKQRGCAEVGMLSDVLRFSASASQKELIAKVRELNNDKSVHGILVQLPLPTGIDAIAVLNEINPDKDVDGLHPLNLGKLLKGEKPPFLPCTPQGIVELVLSTGISIQGKEVVIVGRSNIVGKPAALLFLQHHATVTICHSKTADLGAVTRRADILVAAVGSPGIIHGDMVKDGAVVIDVGTNRVGDKFVGDVDFESVKDRVAFITPVPGGVGPMTIAMLLKNTVEAAKR
ncbi:MAG: bifunctional methylenetetrahydrofolate dehydrogenase/methenyltetrahydrofolate cyclohydrolase FolD [Candidatus Margulisiibacteriota bacterium]